MTNRVLHNLHKVEIDPGRFGSTVRKGDKWADAVPGTEIDLCECLDDTHTVVGHGVVAAMWHGQFYEIPAKLIDYEHEKLSQKYSGLLWSMRRAYGQEFAENDAVVALTYQRVS